MKKTTIALSVAIVAALSAAVVVRMSGQTPRPGAWTPYVRNATYQKLATAKSVADQYSVVTARFGDGSYYETTRTNSVWLVDYRNRTRVQYNLLAKAKTTRTLTQSEVNKIALGVPPFSSRCEEIGLKSRRESAGSEVIAGLTAYAYRGKSSDGRATTTVWFAPELNCEFVKDVHEYPNGESEVRVSTAIYRGEPDPILLNIPPNLTEMSPQEFTAAVVKKWSGMDVPARHLSDREQQLYREQRPQQ